MDSNLDRGSSDEVSFLKVRILPDVKAEVLALAVVLDVNKARICASSIDAKETEGFRPTPFSTAGDVECMHTSLDWLMAGGPFSSSTCSPTTTTPPKMASGSSCYSGTPARPSSSLLP